MAGSQRRFSSTPKPAILDPHRPRDRFTGFQHISKMVCLSSNRATRHQSSDPYPYAEVLSQLLGHCGQSLERQLVVCRHRFPLLPVGQLDEKRLCWYRSGSGSWVPQGSASPYGGLKSCSLQVDTLRCLMGCPCLAGAFRQGGGSRFSRQKENLLAERLGPLCVSVRRWKREKGLAHHRAGGGNLYTAT